MLDEVLVGTVEVVGAGVDVEVVVGVTAVVLDELDVAMVELGASEDDVLEVVETGAVVLLGFDVLVEVELVEGTVLEELDVEVDKVVLEDVVVASVVVATTVVVDGSDDVVVVVAEHSENSDVPPLPVASAVTK